MAINRPDIYRHNNPNLAISDSDFVRGGFRTPVNDLSELYSLYNKVGTDSAPGQLKERSTVVYVNSEGKYYELNDISNVGNSDGWGVFSSGNGDSVGNVINGLTIVSGNTISLGGNLSDNVIINVSGQTFQFVDVNEYQVKTSGDTTILGIDDNGFLLVTTGGTISLDDNGGLKYGDDYSGGYSGLSIPDVNYVTGLTSVYLKLEQDVPQVISGGQPTFEDGIKLGVTPSDISGHVLGRMYYDEEYKTISANIGDETTLQIGQEDLLYVYNNTGSVISNGSVVRSTGVNNNGVDVLTVGLSIASGGTYSNVLGVATQDILVNNYGFVTVRGNVNGINTLDGQLYINFNVGDEIYLSESDWGGVTNVKPESPNR